MPGRSGRSDGESTLAADYIGYASDHMNKKRCCQSDREQSPPSAAIAESGNDRRPAQVDHLAVELQGHLFEMPAPVQEAPHSRDPLATDIACEHRPVTISPVAHGLVADIDPGVEEQVRDVPQRQGEYGHTSSPPSG